MGEMGEENYQNFQVVTILTQNQDQNSQGDVGIEPEPDKLVRKMENIAPHHFEIVIANNSNFTSFTEWLAAGFTKADLQEEANQDHQDCFEHIKSKTSFCYKTIDSSFSFLKIKTISSCHFCLFPNKI